MMWVARNYGGGARMWYIMQDTSPPIYAENAAGHLRRFKSYETAQKAVCRLNKGAA